ASRTGEMAIRSALGASRASLMRQMLVESLLLASAGGALGLLIALWGADGMTAMIPEAMPAWMGVSVDWRVLAFTLGVTTATAMLCGIAPGWQASKTDLMSVMKDGARGAGSLRKHRLRNLLVIGEVALAMTLLIGAGLMMKSFIRVRQVKTGFNAGPVMTAKVSLPETQYPMPAQRNNFFRQLLQRLTATPGVESAAVTSGLPLWAGGISDLGFYVEGRPEPKNSSEFPNALNCAVSPGYFHTMGMRLIRGRDFNDSDVEGKEKVVIVDETIARRIFADEEPIGRRITFGGAKTRPPGVTIVGVVGAGQHFWVEKDAKRQTIQPL